MTLTVPLKGMTGKYQVNKAQFSGPKVTISHTKIDANFSKPKLKLHLKNNYKHTFVFISNQLTLQIDYCNLATGNCTAFLLKMFYLKIDILCCIEIFLTDYTIKITLIYQY